MASSAKAKAKGVPDITLKLGGKDKVKSDDSVKKEMKFRNGENIMGLEVNKQRNVPDSFKVQIKMFQDARILFLDKKLESTDVEILAGFDTKDKKTLIKGEITYIDAVFDKVSGYYLEIGGYDKSHRLTKGTSSKVWGDGVKSETSLDSVVGDIVSGAGDPDSKGSDKLSVSKKDKSPYKTSYIAQAGVSDFDMVQRLGGDFGAKLDQDDANDLKSVALKKLDISGPTLFTACMDKLDGTNPVEVQRVKFSVSTINQYKKVVVKGWDEKNKKTIVGEADSVTINFGGKEGHKVTGKAMYGSESNGKIYTVVNQIVESKEEADAIAQSIFDKFCLSFLQAEIELEGTPEADIGKIVETKGFGKKFDGKYLINGVTHYYYPKETGFKTIVYLASNSLSAEGDDL